jgi:hypothetical protein
LIHRLYILEQNTGRLFFHHNYSKRQYDSAILAGFLSALGSLADEEMTGMGGIDSIAMKNHRWIYLAEKGIYYVFCADLSHSIYHAKRQLRYIAKVFRKKYSKKLLKKWQGKTKTFHGFIKIMDKLLIEWTEARETVEDTKAMDIIGLYEQIFNRMLKTKLKRKKREELYNRIETFTTKEFGEETIHTGNSHIDLFGIMELDLDYDRLKSRLAKLNKIMFNYIKRTADEEDLKWVIEKQLFPLFNRKYKLIDLYNIDRAVLPPIFSYYEKSKFDD